MATEGNQIRESFVATADLEQFRFVTATGRNVAYTAAGAAADGVVRNDPLEGEAATIVNYGRVIVESGGAMDAGDEVASGADGVALAATAGDIVLGKVTEDAVEGQLVTVDFYKGGNEAPA